MQTTSELPAAAAADGGGPAAAESGLAIDARGLSKVYTLYPSPRAQLMDLLGLYRFTPWQKPVFGHHSALGGVDLAIRRGERVGVIGRNGAGKTTLLKLITRAAEPTAGTIDVHGEVQALMQVGLGFHPEFTGAENILASLIYTGLSGDERRAAENDIVAFCELGEYLDQPLKTYSLGMQARLQFACATAIKPEILIVDEILGAGDAYFSVKSSQRMERMTKSGCTLLLVSHSMAQILQFCERCVWVDRGHIVADGPARRVVGEYEVFMENLSAGILDAKADKPISANRTGRSFRLGRSDGIDDRDDDEGPPSVAPSAQARPGAEPAELLGVSASQGASATAASSHEKTVAVLDDGEKVFRWPGEPGPKLALFEICAGGTPMRRVPEGSDLAFRISLRNDSEEPISCRYQVTILSLDNRRITRLVGPIDHFSGLGGEMRKAELMLKPCLLQAGEYYINFAILPADAMRAGVPTRRFDLVVRFADFEISRTLDYRDRCVFNHPAEWITGPDDRHGQIIGTVPSDRNGD